MWYQWKYNVVAVFFFKSDCNVFNFDIKELPDDKDFALPFASTGLVADIAAPATAMDVIVLDQ